MININTLYIIYRVRVRVRVCVREVTTAACTINTRTQSALCVYNGLYMDRCNLRVGWANNNNRNIMYIEHRKPWMLMRSTGVYSDILLWRSRFFRPAITADRPPTNPIDFSTSPTPRASCLQHVPIRHVCKTVLFAAAEVWKPTRRLSIYTIILVT